MRNGGLIFLLLLLLAPVELAAAKVWPRSIPVADQSGLRAVSEFQPAPGGKTPLREPPFRETCRLQGLAIAAAPLIQAALISILLHERGRRNAAGKEARTALSGDLPAIVSISDSGVGIPCEKLADVFDPFFTTKKQGMGMGLSIARTIVHKGRIWAESQPGGGPVFHLTML
jgi:Histidine kinase-, DNA gyrase B-, and HSP90-like ATPase